MMAARPLTTDHAACDSGRSDEAVMWLATTPRAARTGNVIVELRQRFGLSAVEACRAIFAANSIRRGADA
jgi:hypothetical protein